MSRLESFVDRAPIFKAGLSQISFPAAPSHTASSKQNLRLLDFPLEIRRWIWEYVLGSGTYHIVQGKTLNSIVHIRCLNILKCGADGSPNRSATCFTAKMKILDIDPNDMHFFKVRQTAPWSKLGHAKLGLLSTCRQIHEEATQVFWSTNCIEIFDASLLAKFANETELKHLAMIKTLRLHFPRKASSGADSRRFFDSDANILELRNALKKMTALPRLRIALEEPGLVHPHRRISMSGFEAVQLQTVVEVMLPGDLIEAEDLKMVQQICEHRKIAIGQDRNILALGVKTAKSVLQELLLACVHEMILRVRCQDRPYLSYSAGFIHLKIGYKAVDERV